jgi:hypothetical protein
VKRKSSAGLPPWPRAPQSESRTARSSPSRQSNFYLLDAADIGAADNLRVNSRHGIVDILRGRLPPLDYATVSERALLTDVVGEQAPIAAPRSVVGFRRLAGRPRDRNDLEELEALHGELPVDAIPGLDS